MLLATSFSLFNRQTSSYIGGMAGLSGFNSHPLANFTLSFRPSLRRRRVEKSRDFPKFNLSSVSLRDLSTADATHPPVEMTKVTCSSIERRKATGYLDGFESHFPRQFFVRVQWFCHLDPPLFCHLDRRCRRHRSGEIS